MCGRYALFRWPQALTALPGFPAEQQPHWNIAPGANVLMVRHEADARHAALARWGLTPAWLTDLSRTPAQARAETLAEQPMFREAFRQRRCLLPANGFYEWRGAVRQLRLSPLSPVRADSARLSPKDRLSTTANPNIRRFRNFMVFQGGSVNSSVQNGVEQGRSTPV